MRLELLELNHFKSYEQETIDFSSINLASVVGTNGAGKSTIAEATVFALTGGRTIRSRLGEFIMRGARECRVTAVFSAGGEHYRVTRTCSFNKGSTTDVTSALELAREVGSDWVPEGAGVRAMDERLRQILGVDEPTLRLTSFIGQEDAGAFFRLTPGERLGAISGILKLDETYAPLEKWAKAQAEKHRANLELSRRDLERLEGEAEQLPGALMELDDARETRIRALAAVEAAEADLQNARLRAQDAQDGLARARLVKQGLDALKAQRRGSEARLATLASEIDSLSTKVARKPALQDQADTMPRLRESIAELEEQREAQAAIDTQKAALGAELYALGSRVKAIETQQAQAARDQADARRQTQEITEHLETIAAAEKPVCDRCGQRIEDEALAKTVAQLEEERDARQMVWARLEDQLTALRGECADARALAQDLTDRLGGIKDTAFSKCDLDMAKDELTKVERIPALVAAIEEQETRLRAAQAEHQKEWEGLADWTEINAKEAELAGLAGVFEEADAAAQAVTRWETDAKTLRGYVSDADRNVGARETAIAMLQRAEARIAEITEEVAPEAQALADAELLARHMGKWGVPNLIISNVMAALEVHVNQVLAKFDTAFQVRFDFTKEGTSRDTLEIMVWTGEYWDRWENFSGGERYRVAVSMRLGLAQLLAHRAGSKVQTMILDEPEGLDEDGRLKLAGTILPDMAEEFSVILMFSHYDDLKDALPSQIRVTQDEAGHSHAEVAP
jgi:exonuclease SbcC